MEKALDILCSPKSTMVFSGVFYHGSKVTCVATRPGDAGPGRVHHTYTTAHKVGDEQRPSADCRRQLATRTGIGCVYPSPAEVQYLWADRATVPPHPRHYDG